jgi:hypothetical protein
LKHLSQDRHILVVEDVVPPALNITDLTLLTMYRGRDASDREGITDYGDVINDHRQGWNLWPAGPIMYVFDSDLGNCERSTVSVALDVISSANPSLQFLQVERSVFLASGGSVPAIHVTNHDSGCFASLGFRPPASENVVNLGPGCVNVGTAIHLFMHALGVFHEHQRADRDKFVQIVTSNIDQSRMGGNLGSTKFSTVFETNPLSTDSAWTRAVSSLEYDFGSIMHNGPCHYSVDEQLGGGAGGCALRPTLIASLAVGIENYLNSPSSIGNRATLSARDVALLAILYPFNMSTVAGPLKVEDAITGETTLCTVADSAAFSWSAAAKAGKTSANINGTSTSQGLQMVLPTNNPNEIAMFANYFSDPARSMTVYIVIGVVAGLILLAAIAFVVYKKFGKKRIGMKKAIEAPSSISPALPLLGTEIGPEKETGDSTDSEIYADILEDKVPALQSQQLQPPPVVGPSRGSEANV